MFQVYELAGKGEDRSLVDGSYQPEWLREQREFLLIVGASNIEFMKCGRVSLEVSFYDPIYNKALVQEWKKQNKFFEGSQIEFLLLFEYFGNFGAYSELNQLKEANRKECKDTWNKYMENFESCKDETTGILDFRKDFFLNSTLKELVGTEYLEKNPCHPPLYCDSRWLNLYSIPSK